jgi:hypothetical protein
MAADAFKDRCASIFKVKQIRKKINMLELEDDVTPLL